MERVAARLTSVEAVAAKLSTNEHPSGRRLAHRTQGVDTGEDLTSSRTLVRGENSTAYDHEIVLSDEDDEDRSHHEYSRHNTQHRSNFGSRLPKSDFPKFDGDNPK